jgi:ribosomal protein S28E/S33
VGDDGVRVSLEGGRVQATVRPGAGSVGIIADGREVVAEDADFTVARDGAGTFGAEVLRGEAEIRGGPGVSRIPEGARVVAAADADPVVGPADDALLLFVEPLPAPRSRAGSATVSGRSQPGAMVRVGRGDVWVTTRADATGAFRVEVPLVEGENPLRVEARDVFGNIGVGDLRVTRDTLAPSVGIEVRY